MEKKGQIDPQEIQIQGLLDRFLHQQNSSDSAAQTRHLEEDLLAAFTEGSLNEYETRNVVGHLVDCSFCRHVTAELVKLDLAFDDKQMQLPVNENQPSKVSEVLNNLLARIFGSDDSAVFAHQENKDDAETTEKKPQDE